MRYSRTPNAISMLGFAPLTLNLLASSKIQLQRRNRSLSPILPFLCVYDTRIKQLQLTADRFEECIFVALG